MTEQDVRVEVLEVLALVDRQHDDWLVDLLVAKIMRWYHQGGVDALDYAIGYLGSRGETNVVRTLQDGDRIVP